MAQTRFTERWGRLAGTWPEFMAIIRLAEVEAGPTVSFGADVSFGKRIVSVSSIDDLDGIVDAHNRGDVQGVRVEFHGVKGAQVSISAGTQEAATLQVKGEDTTFIEGLHTRLAERLGRLAPWPGRVVGALFSIALAWAVVVTLVLVGARLDLVTFTPTDESSTSSAGLALILGLIVAPIAAVLASESILLTLEILEEPGRHRVRRYGGLIVGLVIAVVIGLVTNALWDAATA